MPCQRSLQIEQRLQAALGLIRRGRYSTPKIAAELHVSMPTVSRLVVALRERGHDIRAEKQTDGWRYVLDRIHQKKPTSSLGRGQPIVKRKNLTQMWSGASFR